MRPMGVTVSTVLGIIAVVWIALAVVVAVHAAGHNRRSVFWFTVTAIGGVFGVMVYLLVITSHGATDPEAGIAARTEIIYLLTALAGLIASLAVAVSFTQSLQRMTVQPVAMMGHSSSPLEGLAPLILMSAGFIGLVGSVSVFHERGGRSVLYYLSYAPMLFVAFIGADILSTRVVTLVSPTRRLFYEGLKVVYAPIVLVLAALIGIEVWRFLLSSVSWFGDGIADTRPSDSGIDRDGRRRAITALGIAGLTVGGYSILWRDTSDIDPDRANKISTPHGIEVTNLSYGYSQTAGAYQISGTVEASDDENLIGKAVEIDYYTGGGVSRKSTLITLKAIGDGASEGFETSIATEPDTIEWFTLEVTNHPYY